MGLESQLIKVLTVEEWYNTYRDWVKPDNFEPNIKKLVVIIDKLRANGAKEITANDLKTMAVSEYPSSMKGAQKEIMHSLIDKIYEEDLDSVTAKIALQNFIKKVKSATMASLGTEWMDNPSKFDIDKIKKLCETSDDEADTVEFDSFTLDELEDKLSPDSGWTWPWESWNVNTGRLNGGRIILLFAYPNMGKSALCHSISTHLARQTKVLVINNEEDPRDVQARAMSCHCKMKIPNLFKYRDVAEKRWSTIKDNWTLKHDTSLTVPIVKNYIKASGAKVVIIDQAVKIKVKQTERRDADMGTIFRQLRDEIQGEFSDVDIIGVGRGDISSKTAKVVTMDMLADCKSEVQGELDGMIGMNRPGDGDYVNIFWNKMKRTGAEGRMTTLQLEREYSRVIEIKQ